MNYTNILLHGATQLCTPAELSFWRSRKNHFQFNLISEPSWLNLLHKKIADRYIDFLMVDVIFALEQGGSHLVGSSHSRPPATKIKIN